MKRSYEAPRLMRHGTVAEITRGGGSTISSDKSSGQVTNGTASDADLKREIRRVGGALLRLRRLGS